LAQTQEDAKRLELIDKFLAAHGSHASAPGALGQADYLRPDKLESA
jgi:hypothetical protein